MVAVAPQPPTPSGKNGGDSGAGMPKKTAAARRHEPGRSEPPRNVSTGGFFYEESSRFDEQLHVHSIVATATVITTPVVALILRPRSKS